MSEADLSDVFEMAEQDSDVAELIRALKKVVHKRGIGYVTRVFAAVLAPAKRNRFEEMLEVKESRTQKFVGMPSDLAGEEHLGYSAMTHSSSIDHPTLWQRQGKLIYLTSEPYYVPKEELKHLIAHCDRYGIDFQIDAESCYYPGHTVRILFKKGAISPYDALQQTEGEPQW